MVINMWVLLAMYNEMPWTPYALRHALEFDCPILLCEGGGDKSPDNPRSTDGTLELCDEFASRHKHVKYVRTRRGMTRFHAERYLYYHILKDREWYLSFGGDNYYRDEDIPKLKDVLLHADGHIVQALTKMYVFVFNFQTIITESVHGLCGAWVSFWPCIQRKNDKYGLRYGDELLIDRTTGEYVASPSIVQASLRPASIRNDIMMVEDVIHFHYKGVKKTESRMIRYGDEGGKIFQEHPLEAPYLKYYDGDHPTILDDHPWRYTKDCRKEEV
jgi:hypothetical protein